MNTDSVYIYQTTCITIGISGKVDPGLFNNRKCGKPRFGGSSRS